MVVDVVVLVGPETKVVDVDPGARVVEVVVVVVVAPGRPVVHPRPRVGQISFFFDEGAPG